MLQGNRRLRFSRLVRLIAALLIAVSQLLLIPLAQAASIPSNFFFVIDQQGVNDQPNQKDLTEMGRDDQSDPNYLKIFWSWDDTSFSSQRGDACALFDSDGDGNVNFAVCGEVQNSGSAVVQSATSPTVWSCNDARTDRCS